MDRHSVKSRAAFAATLMLVASVALAATFNLYSPANGIQKNTGSTYANTAATSADVIGLWLAGATCDSTTYLRGDGGCQTPPGAGGGSVNSVGLSAPSGFSVSGSPVTNTGTLALSFATGQTANRFLATPDGTTGALSLRAVVAGDLPAINLAAGGAGGVTGILPGANGGTGNGFFAVTGPASSLRTFTFPNASATVLTSNAAVTVAQGGTGAATLTGPLKGNGTSAFTAATSADMIGLWTGTCNSGTFLRADGSCQSVAGSGTVTSVAASVPSVFSITGSPVTTTGTLAIDWATGQTQNRVLASPNGSSGAVALRALVGADIPVINLASIDNAGGVTGNLPVSRLNSGTGATANTVWHGNATWGAVSLTADVSGILPGANGGSGNGFFAVSGPASSLRTFTFPNASATVLTSNAAVTVAQGGTGAATLSGVLKGNGTSAIGAAASADVIALWTGTCNSTTYLRADGSCQAAAGGGGVSSVGLSAPSVFSVSGSPVTSSGTLALSFATGQTQNMVLASPNGSSGAVALRALVGADLPAINMASGVTGTLPVANGGSGVATLTGLAVGNGTSAFSAYPGATCTNQFIRLLSGSGSPTCASVALATDVSGNLSVNNLNGGTSASNATVWRGDGTWSGGITGTWSATTFSGSGASLTSLNAANVSSGTLDNARLPSTINVNALQVSSVSVCLSNGTNCPVTATGTGASGTWGISVTGNAATATAATSATTATTASIANALNTGSSYQVGSLGVGTAATGTVGEIRATNNVTAYYSSDARLKTNVRRIPDALAKVAQLRGVTFDWTDAYIAEHGGEDGYFIRRHDVGVIAQDVEKVLPELVGTREDGYKAVKYDRLVALLIESVKDLKAQNDELYARVKRLESQR